jgi:hypothetical protein
LAFLGWIDLFVCLYIQEVLPPESRCILYVP